MRRRGACPCFPAPSLAGVGESSRPLLNSPRGLGRTPYAVCTGPGVRRKDSGRPRTPRNGECAGAGSGDRPRGLVEPWAARPPLGQGRSLRTRVPGARRSDLGPLQLAARGLSRQPHRASCPAPARALRPARVSSAHTAQHPARLWGDHVEGRGGSSTRPPGIPTWAELWSVRPPVPTFTSEHLFSPPSSKCLRSRV